MCCAPGYDGGQLVRDLDAGEVRLFLQEIGEVADHVGQGARQSRVFQCSATGRFRYRGGFLRAALYRPEHQETGERGHPEDQHGLLPRKTRRAP